MKDLKYTSGEWITNEGQIYPQETGKTLALIPYFDKDSEEMQSNAKLIAAAPDLLKACIDFIEEETGNGLYGPKFPLIVKIKEAINKAVI